MQFLKSVLPLALSAALVFALAPETVESQPGGDAKPNVAESGAGASGLEPSRLLSPLTLGPFTSVLSRSDLSSSPAADGQEFGFDQTIVLQAYGGTASKVSLRISEPAAVSQVRLLAVADGTLRVVPFVWNAAQQTLQAKFLTPNRSLQYQFQFVFADGSGQLSKWFSLSDTCFERIPVSQLAELSDEKRQLAAELVAIDRDTARLAHALAAIQDLLEVKR